ncbi:hypothetical protein [Haloarchaeobius sp. DFWS5]|uniref:hypothetical protein n=1 Tax=Haloarchaeobius sp. DFWS5 TaxID=3446114 RepID=UPI003EBFB0F9
MDDESCSSRVRRGDIEFEVAMQRLLREAHGNGVQFDRSWTFRDLDSDAPDLMVEVTVLASQA